MRIGNRVNPFETAKAPLSRHSSGSFTRIVSREGVWATARASVTIINRNPQSRALPDRRDWATGGAAQIPFAVAGSTLKFPISLSSTWLQQGNKLRWCQKRVVKTPYPRFPLEVNFFSQQSAVQTFAKVLRTSSSRFRDVNKFWPSELS